MNEPSSLRDAEPGKPVSRIQLSALKDHMKPRWTEPRDDEERKKINAAENILEQILRYDSWPEGAPLTIGPHGSGAHVEIKGAHKELSERTVPIRISYLRTSLKVVCEDLHRDGGLPAVKADIKKQANRVNVWSVEWADLEPTPRGDPVVDLHYMRDTKQKVLGRGSAVDELDRALERAFRVVTIPGVPAIGKTALVNHWLKERVLQGESGFRAGWASRGLRRVFGWSFDRESTGGAPGLPGTASSDNPFLERLYNKFGPSKLEATANPNARGRELADLVAARPTLLVLDGLEAVHTPDGKLTDPVLREFLLEVARRPRWDSWCVVTCWSGLPELEGYTVGSAGLEEYLAITEYQRGYSKNVLELTLGRLDRTAAIQVLEDELGHSMGAPADKNAAAHACDDSPFRLRLLGGRLTKRHGGRVECWKEADPGKGLDDQLEGYAEWLEKGDPPALALMHVLGLFEGPPGDDELDALLKPPSILGLTDSLPTDRTSDEWAEVIRHLRQLNLLESGSQAPFALVALSSVREYFARRLQLRNPAAWQESHFRLYDLYRAHEPVADPSGQADLRPLRRAVYHGCRAGRYEEAFRKVFWSKIQGGRYRRLTYQRGAIALEHEILKEFFKPGTWTEPVDDLPYPDNIVAIMEGGLQLWHLGRLEESLECWQAAAGSKGLHPLDRAMTERRLAEILLNMGRIEEAMVHAEKAVRLAPPCSVGMEGAQAHALLDEQCGVVLDDPFNNINQCEPMDTRIILGHVLHQAGQIARAEKYFRAAEKIQRRRPGCSRRYLNGIFNFWFIILLLDRGKREEVQARLKKLVRQTPAAAYILWRAMDNLSLGYSYLPAAAGPVDGVDADNARKYLESKPDLEGASQLPHLPFAWLAWADVYTLRGEYDEAYQRLQETRAFAERNQMWPHVADCDLKLVRLHLDCRDHGQAESAYCNAARLVLGMRYKKRYDTLIALGEELFRGTGYRPESLGLPPEAAPSPPPWGGPRPTPPGPADGPRPAGS